MAMTQRPRSALPALFLSLALLLALALRFYRIEAQSLWYDEGNSARLVERPVRLIIEGAAGDIHPRFTTCSSSFGGLRSAKAKRRCAHSPPCAARSPSCLLT